jgi:hypothetical protein
MSEHAAVKSGCIFNALLFPFVLAASVIFQKWGIGGAVLLGGATAQLFSLSYFCSLLLLKFLPFSMTMLPVFGGFFLRMIVLSVMTILGQLFFPGSVPFFAIGFGVTTFITLIAETVIFLKVEMR